MIAEKKLETLEHSSARLTVTVDSETTRKEYDELVRKYCRTAQIKGFRKGKVPANILEKKFGESIRAEAGMQVIESSLEEALKDLSKKPLQIEPPSLENEEIKLEPGADFTYTVTYDVFPEITLGEYTGIEVEQPEVTVEAADIDRELERIREQNSIVIEKADEEPIGREDIVTVDFVELDDQGEIESTRRQDFTFAVGTGYNRYRIDDELCGMKKGDTTTIEKKYDETFEDSELANRTVRLSVTIKVVKRKELPALDDELAQDVSEEYQTLDDLKKEIERRLGEAVESRIRSRSIDKIMEKIVESSVIDLPESMVRAELEGSWRTTLARSRVDEAQMLRYLEAQERTKEQILEERRPDAERTIRTRLVMNEIKEKERIEATDEELDAEITDQAKRANQDVESVREQIEKAEAIDYLKNQIADRKLIDLLIGRAKLGKGPKTSLMDLLQDNQ